MTSDSQENVQPLPKREPMPPEFAAISFRPDGDDEATVILNTEQEHESALQALRKLRPNVVIPVLAGAIAEKIAGTFRRHPATSAIASTIVATSLAASGLIAGLDARDDPPPSPPTAIRKVTMHPPRGTQAVTTTPGKTTTPAAPPATQRLDPPLHPQTATTMTSGPTPPRATRSHHLASPRPTPDSTTGPPAPVGQPVPQATRTASPSPSPLPSTANPPPSPPTMADDECTIHVDVQPLLDVCLRT